MSHFGRMNLKMYFVFFILACCFVYVGTTLYNVQVVNHEYYYGRARSAYTKTISLPKMRGKIYDCDGNLLVGNLYSVSFFADPSRVGSDENCRRIALFFADRTDVSFDTLFSRLSRRTNVVYNKETGKTEERKIRDVVLVRDIEYERAQEISSELDELSVKGIRTVFNQRRHYPKNELLSNVLGYTDTDYSDKAGNTKGGGTIVARGGIEKVFDLSMQPKSGEMSIEKDPRGQRIVYGEKIVKEAGYDGADLFLTIREPLQGIVEDEIQKLYDKWKPLSVSAIMVDPETGDVLALAQRPSFNPNDRSSMSEPSRMRLCFAEDTFEPGSVMKPIVCAWALDRRFVTPDTVIDSPLSRIWYYQKRPLRDSHVIGKTDVRGHLRESSNIAFAKIAVRMGRDELLKCIRSYGFLSKSGLPFKPENDGFTVKKENWYPITTSRVPIGQSINVTTLQLARAYSMLANGGYRVDLRIVDRVRTNGEMSRMPVIRSSSSIFLNPERTRREIVEMMKDVVMSGTGTKAQIKGYFPAAKTGTGERVEGGVYVKKFNTSFCGFVPADNPRFVLVVTVNEPQGKESELYGGTVAGPAFGEIARQSLEYLRVRKEVEDDVWEAKRKERVQHRREDRERFANRRAEF